METITIPSPSAFLRKSPIDNVRSIPRRPSPIRSTKNLLRRPLASSGEPPRKSSAGVHNAGIAKPKQSKSRNGCITCKGKRLKCDETKPVCEQCRKRNVQCGGYSKAFKWRAFEEANFTGKSGLKPKKVSPPPPTPALRNPSSQVLSQSSPSNDSNSGPTPTPGTDYELKQTNPRSDPLHDPYQIPLCLNVAHIPVSPCLADRHDYIQQPHLQNVYQHPPYANLYAQDNLPNLPPSSDSLSQPKPIPPSWQPPSFASGSPTLRDILLPGTDMNSPPPSIEPRPPQSPLPYMPSGYTPPGGTDLVDEDEEGEEDEEDEDAEDAEDEEEDAEDAEEIIREDDPAGNPPRATANHRPFCLPSASPGTSSSSASSASSTMDLWAQPRLALNSQEMLLVQFDRHTCGILSVKDGPNENPWRTMVWPLAQDSEHLYHAIASLTAFHSSKASPELRVDGMRHLNTSVSKLAMSLNDIKFDCRPSGNGVEAALATTLVLAFGETWDLHVSTGIKHLKGARCFVDQAVVKYQKGLREGRDDPRQLNRLRFLCNSFIYMDVTARLTSLEEDDFGDLDHVLAILNQPFNTMPEIDPLMGAASTLFPLIGRVAAIVTRVRKSKSNSFTLISDAIELKRRIEQWQPPASVSFEVPEDPTSDVQHSIQTAEAYRWATLLYLHQAVPEIPSDPAAVLADRVLKYLATVPLSSRAIIVQIFPLLAASCEAITQEDRNWVRNRWAAMSARMSIGNVDKCFEVIKEAWDRRDVFEAEKMDRLWKRQAARGLNMNGLSSPSASRCLKRKASGAEIKSGSNVNILGDSEPASSGLRSVTKPRAMTEQSGPPRATRFDDQGTRVLMNMDASQTAVMQLPRLPTRSPSTLQSPTQQRWSDTPLEGIEGEYTVRGRLHWIGVMSDHEWEGEILRGLADGRVSHPR